MKNSVMLILLSLSCILPTAPSQAGNGGVSGGGGFIKEGPDGEVLDAVLLDLWEGENGLLTHAPGQILNPTYSSDPFLDQVQNALKRLADASSLGFEEPMYKDYLESFRHVVQAANQLPLADGVEIKFPEDAKSNYMKTGYRETGIGLYNDAADKLTYSPRITQATKPTTYAAFLMHESVYRALRRAYKGLGVRGMRTYQMSVLSEDSRYARYVTTCLFSQDCDVRDLLLGESIQNRICQQELRALTCTGKKGALVEVSICMQDPTVQTLVRIKAFGEKPVTLSPSASSSKDLIAMIDPSTLGTRKPTKSTSTPGSWYFVQDLKAGPEGDLHRVVVQTEFGDQNSYEQYGKLQLFYAKWEKDERIKWIGKSRKEDLYCAKTQPK